MIDIYLLQQLVTFAEYGTLSAASEKLHTSQPAMTRAMKKIEDELGVSLFVRSKNHLSLNDTGNHAAAYARQVLSACRDFENRVIAYDRSLHTISIGFCAPVPQTVLTPIINSLFSGMTISADTKNSVQTRNLNTNLSGFSVSISRICFVANETALLPATVFCCFSRLEKGLKLQRQTAQTLAAQGFSVLSQLYHQGIHMRHWLCKMVWTLKLFPAI